MEWIEIDASQGEGGGQIVRSSVALSMLTGVAVRLEKIRQRRTKPGLMRQHMTAVKAAASLCDARLEGATVGSDTLVFEPRREVEARDATFKIGTAGSTGLVFQTLLPALMCAEQACEITIHGGTHNPMAPSFDFLKAVFLPQLQAMGPHVELSCEAHGFYPAGGGVLRARIEPVAREAMKRYVMCDAGEEVSRRADVLSANLPSGIARREAEAFAQKMGWDLSECRCREVDSPGPGNVVMATLRHEHITEHFEEYGRKGKAGELVVSDLVKEIRRYLTSSAPVGEHLADQLLLPMALGAGGEFLCTNVSLHTRTQAEIIEKFLEVEISMERVDEEQKVWRVCVEH